jgi:beta-lactam-binding protein with PASTA domain
MLLLVVLVVVVAVLIFWAWSSHPPGSARPDATGVPPTAPAKAQPTPR